MGEYTQYIRNNLLEKFEFQNYGHALEILNEAFPEEWNDIQNALACLIISIDDLKAAGGNETAIPKKFDDVLYPLGWREIRITGDLLVKLYGVEIGGKRHEYTSTGEYEGIYSSARHR